MELFRYYQIEQTISVGIPLLENMFSMLFQDVISDMAARPPLALSCFISYHRDFDYKIVNLRNFNSFWLVCVRMRPYEML